MTVGTVCGSTSPQVTKDADYVFYELTRSICPNCRRVIDAKIVLRDNNVYMHKRCPQCGPFEALVYADAEAYTAFGKYNKPGTIPLAHGSEGRDDYNVSASLAAEWFERVKAPSKILVWFDRLAHDIVNEEPGKFLLSLVHYARPIAEQAGDIPQQ